MFSCRNRKCATCVNQLSCPLREYPTLPEPSVECCQKCASCWRVPTCDALAEHLDFAKEIPAAQSFKKICRAEDRAQENFHNCLACRDILSCKILKRARTIEPAPEPPKPVPEPEKPARKVDWFVDHMLLKEGEKFSWLKVLRRLFALLSR